MDTGATTSTSPTGQGDTISVPSPEDGEPYPIKLFVNVAVKTTCPKPFNISKTKKERCQSEGNKSGGDKKANNADSKKRQEKAEQHIKQIQIRADIPESQPDPHNSEKKNDPVSSTNQSLECINNIPNTTSNLISKDNSGVSSSQCLSQNLSCSSTKTVSVPSGNLPVSSILHGLSPPKTTKANIKVLPIVTVTTKQMVMVTRPSFLSIGTLGRSLQYVTPGFFIVTPSSILKENSLINPISVSLATSANSTLLSTSVMTPRMSLTSLTSAEKKGSQEPTKQLGVNPLVKVQSPPSFSVMSGNNDNQRESIKNVSNGKSALVSSNVSVANVSQGGPLDKVVIHDARLSRVANADQTSSIYVVNRNKENGNYYVTTTGTPNTGEADPGRSWTVPSKSLAEKSVSVQSSGSSDATRAVCTEHESSANTQRAGMVSGNTSFSTMGEVNIAPSSQSGVLDSVKSISVEDESMHVTSSHYSNGNIMSVSESPNVMESQSKEIRLQIDSVYSIADKEITPNVNTNGKNSKKIDNKSFGKEKRRKNKWVRRLRSLAPVNYSEDATAERMPKPQVNAIRDESSSVSSSTRKRQCPPNASSSTCKRQCPPSASSSTYKRQCSPDSKLSRKSFVVLERINVNHSHGSLNTRRVCDKACRQKFVNNFRKKRVKYEGNVRRIIATSGVKERLHAQILSKNASIRQETTTASTQSVPKRPIENIPSKNRCVEQTLASTQTKPAGFQEQTTCREKTSTSIQRMSTSLQERIPSMKACIETTVVSTQSIQARLPGFAFPSTTAMHGKQFVVLTPDGKTALISYSNTQEAASAKNVNMQIPGSHSLLRPRSSQNSPDGKTALISCSNIQEAASARNVKIQIPGSHHLLRPQLPQNSRVIRCGPSTPVASSNATIVSTAQGMSSLSGFRIRMPHLPRQTTSSGPTVPLKHMYFMPVNKLNSLQNISMTTNLRYPNIQNTSNVQGLHNVQTNLSTVPSSSSGHFSPTYIGIPVRTTASHNLSTLHLNSAPNSLVQTRLTFPLACRQTQSITNSTQNTSKVTRCATPVPNTVPTTYHSMAPIMGSLEGPKTGSSSQTVQNISKNKTVENVPKFFFVKTESGAIEKLPVSAVVKSKVSKGTKYYFVPDGVRIKTEPISHLEEERTQRMNSVHKVRDTKKRSMENEHDGADNCPAMKKARLVDKDRRADAVECPKSCLGKTTDFVNEERIQNLKDLIQMKQKKLEELRKECIITKS